MLIKLSAEELFDVHAATAAAIHGNEASTIGCIRLTAKRGGPRRWQATNSIIASVLLGGPSDDDIDVLLSPRLLPTEVHREDEPILEIPHDATSAGGPLIKLHLNGFSIAQAPRQLQWPDLEAVIRNALEDDEVATARFDRTAALRALERISLRPRGADDTLNPPAYLEVGPDLLRLSVDWPGWGQSEVQIAASTSGRASVPVGPMRLRELLECAPDEIEFRIPLEATRPLLAHAPDRSWFGLLKGRQLFPAPARIVQELQEVLAQGFGLVDLEPDNDGDIPVPFEDETVYLRAVDGRPPIVQTFSIVAHDSEPDEDLYRKINDLNTVVRWGRLFWVQGQVLCEIDLDFASDADDLRAAFHTLIDTTRMVRALFSETPL